MSKPVLLVTLGQCPEAVTVALDVLLPRYHYDEIGVVHTDPTYSGIAAAYRELLPRLHADYPACDITAHELRSSDGKPLLDITDQASAEAYFYGLAEVIRAYRQRYIPVHLLVSGGRKAMSIYAWQYSKNCFLWRKHTPLQRHHHSRSGQTASPAAQAKPATAGIPHAVWRGV